MMYKYNTSVDNTKLYLHAKIVYFVRAICFDLIRSSSGPPRRYLHELFMGHVSRSECRTKSQYEN